MPAILVSAAVLLLLAPPQSTGTYRIQLNGKPAGQEQFEIVTQNETTTIKSHAQTTATGAAQKIITTTEIQNDKPVRYTVETVTGVNSQKYSLEFKEGVIHATIEAHGRKSERTRNVTRDVILLDRGVWHHYRFLLARYDMKAGGIQRFRVFSPLSGLRDFWADVRFLRRENFKSGQTKRSGDLFSIVLAEAFEVLVIADDARVPVSIEVPSEKTRAVLE
ncbi:MAG: hypothetical protein AB1631_26270 [Acidobacteriota bacterium]